MKRRTVSLIVLVACGIAFGQTDIKLVVTETVASAEPAPEIVLPAKCDLDQNINVRVQGFGPVGNGPVLRISPDATRITRFSLEAAKDLLPARILDFSPGPQGTMYLLVLKNDNGDEHTFILGFDSVGSLVSRVEVPKVLQPKQLAAFGSGGFLIAGLDLPKAKTAADILNAQPFVGLFDSTAQLKRQVFVTHDPKPKVAFEKTPMNETFAVLDRSYAETMVFSAMTLADDGDVYLMRHAPSGPIYQISPAGVVRKTYELKPPSGAALSGFIVSHGTIVAKYIRFKADSHQIDTVILQVLDADTGAMRRQYMHSDSRIGSVLACYDQQQFTFLGSTPNSRLALVKVGAE